MTDYDLIICGGGLAGLGLARQLRLNGDESSILVLDPLTRPLPQAGFKIGESTIEVGAYYYFDRLGLFDYLEREHLEKLGLRYFYQGQDGFASRPEYGCRRFLPAKSYQVDRGAFEEHLRGLVAASNVELLEGVRVKDIDLDGRGPHTVSWTDAAGARHDARGRWVIDAMGRRRYLQHKLGLARPAVRPRGSSWWRVKGKVSVNDFVPGSETSWHGRIVDDRWQSTTHLMGRGYWVWLIPLAPDNTSVGIVTLEDIHPFTSYGTTYEQSVAWLRAHEPLVAEAMEGREVIDFKHLRSYSYTSTQVFSYDRWACTGVSGVFADPYYSVGSNIIGFANGFIQRMMALDRDDGLTQEYVAHANQYQLTLNDALTDTISRGYPNHHIGPIMALKTIWDYYVGWGTSDPQFYHEVYLDPTLARTMSGIISRMSVTQARMMALFEDWGRMTDRTGYTFDYIDYIDDLPTLKALHLQNLPPKSDDFRRLLQNVREAVNRIEELAQVIFRLAVRDVLPAEAHRVERGTWLNTEAIGLDPARWEADGLFVPRSPARDMSAHEDEITRLFASKPVEVAPAL